jgi:hypothetical protein
VVVAVVEVLLLLLLPPPQADKTAISAIDVSCRRIGNLLKWAPNKIFPLHWMIPNQYIPHIGESLGSLTTLPAN